MRKCIARPVYDLLRYDVCMTEAQTLCKACGLCCTGHLFTWVKLRPSELDQVEQLGVHVLRSHPRQRGFNQPCVLWDGLCTAYGSPQYPHACRAYHCKLLKELMSDQIDLVDALQTVEQATDMIRLLEQQLPASTETSFRQRLATELERTHGIEPQFKIQAEALLKFYEEVFGVDDVVAMSEG